MPRYWLSNHSYICFAESYAVFLNLTTDRYTALDLSDITNLFGSVCGWPNPRNQACSAFDETNSAEVAAALFGEGLLTDDESSGKPAMQLQLERAATSLLVTPGPARKLPLPDVRNFVLAWAVTGAMLRCKSLKYIVDRVRKRKELTHRKVTLFDMSKARSLALSYIALQPKFFSGHDACLRNSLTFIEFFARYRLHPTWVFGVRMNPFSAHSWVQHGPVVLNDEAAHVNTFTPIMIV